MALNVIVSSHFSYFLVFQSEFFKWALAPSYTTHDTFLSSPQTLHRLSSQNYNFTSKNNFKKVARSCVPLQSVIGLSWPRTLKVQDTKSGGLWEAGGGTRSPRLKCLWTITWRLVSLLRCTRIDHSFGLFFYPWIFGGEKLIHKHGKTNPSWKWFH